MTAPHLRARPDRPTGARPAAFLRCESGAAILEFAIALPILFALVAGCFEFGRTLLVRQAMVEAVRGGSRYLARVPDPSCNVACSAGALRAIAMTRDQIARNSRLPPEAVDVTSRWMASTGTVQVTATVRIKVDLLGFLGLAPDLRLEVEHQEAWVAS